MCTRAPAGSTPISLEQCSKDLRTRRASERTKMRDDTSGPQAEAACFESRAASRNDPGVGVTGRAAALGGDDAGAGGAAAGAREAVAGAEEEVADVSDARASAAFAIRAAGAGGRDGDALQVPPPYACTGERCSPGITTAGDEYESPRSPWSVRRQAEMHALSTRRGRILRIQHGSRNMVPFMDHGGNNAKMRCGNFRSDPAAGPRRETEGITRFTPGQIRILRMPGVCPGL